MRTPESLLFKEKAVANLYQFSYETPWASAYAEFIDAPIGIKLERLTAFRSYDLELEELGLPDEEAEVLWEKKLSELGLTHSDLKLNKDEFWSVKWSDGNVGEVRAIRYADGVLEWRA